MSTPMPRISFARSSRTRTRRGSAADRSTAGSDRSCRDASCRTSAPPRARRSRSPGRRSARRRRRSPDGGAGGAQVHRREVAGLPWREADDRVAERDGVAVLHLDRCRRAAASPARSRRAVESNPCTPHQVTVYWSDAALTKILPAGRRIEVGEERRDARRAGQQARRRRARCSPGPPRRT